MKTEHLEYFIDISTSKSLSKTADNFFTSHQVVKKALKNLEDELNVKLINTSNQGSTLTLAGEVFLRYAQHMLLLTGDLNQELAPFIISSSNNPKKIIEFCMTPYLTDSMVLNFIDDYQNCKPEITIELQSLPAENMYEQIVHPYSIFIIPTIKDATLDEKFVQDLQDKHLDFFILAERPLYICTYEKTKWAQKTFYTNDELEKIPMLISSSITLNTNFMNRKNQQLVYSIVAQKSLIKKGAGITIVTKKEFEFYFKSDNKYLIVATDLQPVWYICIHQKDIEIPDYVGDFLKQLKNVF